MVDLMAGLMAFQMVIHLDYWMESQKVPLKADWMVQQKALEKRLAQDCLMERQKGLKIWMAVDSVMERQKVPKMDWRMADLMAQQMGFQ